MNKIKITAITTLLLLIAATVIHAQNDNRERDTFSQEAAEPDQQGTYEKAVTTAQNAIEMAEANLGPDHPYVAITLKNLADLYSKHGDYAKAEPLYKRSLIIWEKALGPNHPYVANCLHNLSQLYHAMGKDKEASEVDEKAARISVLKR